MFYAGSCLTEILNIFKVAHSSFIASGVLDVLNPLSLDIWIPLLWINSKEKLNMQHTLRPWQQ